MLSVDKYGVWSDWWRDYYIKNSKAYKPEQIYISGPMRPLIKKEKSSKTTKEPGAPLKILFVSEQLAIPEEVMPYLEALIDRKDVSVYLTFRPYRDTFETWLKANKPEILDRFGPDRILRDGINDAISKCDLVVGTMSTAVIEALYDLKPMLLFYTKKWGDYFDLENYSNKYKFYAENPEEFVNYIEKRIEIPASELKRLRERFFGDPYKNGSKWVVEEVESELR